MKTSLQDNTEEVERDSTQHIEHPFSIAMEVTKAHAEHTTNGTVTKMVIMGIASNTRRDLQNHAFTIEGLQSIEKAIADGITDEDGEWSHIPLRNGHKGEWDDKLGDITRAHIDEENNLWITAELDIDNHASQTLYRKVSKGNIHGKKPELGLSVKGQTTKYRFAYDPEAKSRITYIDNLAVTEVSVTGKPVNPTPYPLAIAKSLFADPEYQALEKTMENLEVEKSDVVALPTPIVEEQNTQAVADAAADVIVRGDTVTTDAVVDDAAPNTESTEQVTQEVVTEPVVADAQNDLNASIAALTQLVQALQADVNAIKNQNVEVQKGFSLEEDESNEHIVVPEPTNDDEFDSRVALAITKALGELDLSTQLKSVQSALAAISAQPNDKSIAISKSKDEEDESDPQTKLQKLVSKGKDPILAAFDAARAREAAARAE
jgi:hypothetical protein